jgi:TatD DNase family protein
VPVIVKKDKHFQELVKEVDLKNILTETDSPYLGIVKRNEPYFVDESLKKIAEIKNLEKTFVEEKISENFSKIFLK